jgi:hypothetical protein
MPDESFAEHRTFEARGDGYAATTARFEASVTPGRPHRLRAELPTLDAVVVGETVAEVVEEGWFETFEARLAGLDGVTEGSVEPPAVSREEDTVVVEVAFEGGGDPASDAAALLNFVEGTWIQGIVPGYDYREDVQSVRERARDRGG